MVKHKILRLISILFISIIICITSTLLLERMKVVETVEQHTLSKEIKYEFLSYYNEYFSNNITTAMYDMSITDLNNLEDQSEYIFLVELQDRFQPNSNYISCLKVLNQYKGEEYHLETLFLLEPVMLLENQQDYSVRIPMSWYLPIEAQQTFIVFLTKDDGYGREDLFNLVSVPYGKVPTKNPLNIGLLDRDKGVVVLSKLTYSLFDIAFPKVTGSEDIEADVEDTFIKDIYLKIITEANEKYLQQDIRYIEMDIKNER